MKIRLFWKITLVKLLYKKGYNKEDILNLYGFIDWIMDLPAELSARFHEELVKYEEGKDMPYITTAERIGIEKGERTGIEKGERTGIEKGKLEGKLEDAKVMLSKRMNRTLISEITGLSVNEIMKLEETS